MYRHPFSALALIAAFGTSAFGDPEAPKYAGKVSALRVEAAALGNGWTGPTGLVVDDFRDLDAHPPEVRRVVEELKKQVAPLGVTAAADFTYRKASDPFEAVTLRIFVFDSEKSRRDWWRKKYQFDGWEKLYGVVEGVPYDALDSKQTPKRIVSFGNVLLTCGQLKTSGDHRKVLDLYVAKIKDAVRGGASK